MNLFIAIPAGDGKITATCADSVIKAVSVLRDEGHIVTTYFHPANCYIAAARNICVYYFLKSDCSDLIFIDADVGFDRDSISKIIKHDKDMVAGLYPFKQDHEGYPMRLLFDKDNNCREEETGLVYADMVPTGFLRIKRSVFERMAEHYNMQKTHEEMYSFFDTGMVFPNDNTWYGEDVVFCKRWSEMGGKMFIEPRINFIHTGMKHWKGNLHEWLLSRRVDKWTNVLDNVDGIPGWTSPDELQILSMFARRSDSVIEIGSWKGRSTKALLENCKGKVYAVDHWKGTDTDLSLIAAAGRDIFSEFQSNVGHFPNLEVLRGYSLEVAGSLNGLKADMVFIDADHSYDAVKADIEAWLPRCKRIICGHDYKFDDVKRAVTEKFGSVNVVDSLWWVELGN